MELHAALGALLVAGLLPLQDAPRPPRGYLGVQLTAGAGGLRVGTVVPDAPAAKAPIEFWNVPDRLHENITVRMAQKGDDAPRDRVIRFLAGFKPR